MQVGECLEIKVEDINLNYRSILPPAENTKEKGIDMFILVK